MVGVVPRVVMVVRAINQQLQELECMVMLVELILIPPLTVLLQVVVQEQRVMVIIQVVDHQARQV